MKKICAVMMLVVFAFAAGYGQTSIEPKNVALAYDKTTNLVFPYAIKSVDRGSRDVLVQKAKGVENVLQVKAGKEGFDATNLTVITADGNLYSFLLGYSQYPDLNLRLQPPLQANHAMVKFTTPEDHESEIQDAAERIALKQPVMSKRDKHFDISLRLSGIYVQENVMYYQLDLENDSHIDYNISQLRFYIRDKKKSKRTASQEIELQPLYTCGNIQILRGHSRQTIVIALDKHTLPDKKYLSIQMMEGNGGRHLQLGIGNNTIVSSRQLR